MTKHFDHDGSDPLDSPLAGILSEAMSSRHQQLHNSQGSIHDVRMRAHRITRRRTAVGAGALVAVGAVGAIAVASRNGDGGGGQRIVAGGSGEPSDAATAPGSDGGYWECTGPLYPNALSGTYETIVSSAGVITAPDLVPADFPSTVMPPLVDTTVPPYFPTTTDNLPTTTTDQQATTTTVLASTVPHDPTSTTVALSASTSTVDPGLATATSILYGREPAVPVPVPDGVFYMQDCTFVERDLPTEAYPTVGTASVPDTSPAVEIPTDPALGTTRSVDTASPGG